MVSGQQFRADSTDQVSYLNVAPFVQGLLKTSVVNMTIGARYDISSAFGSAFNPRLGVTRRVGIFNFKFLYASSFRAPAIESIQQGMFKMRLKPQRSSTMEFEASVKLRKDMYLSVNVFDINTTDAIRYFVKADSPITGYPDGYRNSRVAIGSKGLELEYKYKSDFGSFNFIYSHYSVGNKGVDRGNNVPADRTQTLGIAKNKLTIAGSFNITPKIFLSPSLNILGRRWGTTGIDSNDRGVFSEFKSQTTINLYAGSSLLVRNMTIGAGIRNITNTDIIYIQAYNSLHAPLPGMGREYYLKISYQIPFKKQS
jgi:outer membrane receptor protein involved in Fe transport